MFYSQTLTKKTIDNLCVRCETRFNQWSEYHKHMTGIKCKVKIVALNISGRSKAQIVADWESKNERGIIQ